MIKLTLETDNEIYEGTMKSRTIVSEIEECGVWGDILEEFFYALSAIGYSFSLTPTEFRELCEEAQTDEFERSTGFILPVMDAPEKPEWRD